MTARVFIDGAVGTTGLEIAERLAGRSEFALVALPKSAARTTARARRGAQRGRLRDPVPARRCRARGAWRMIDKPAMCG